MSRSWALIIWGRRGCEFVKGDGRGEPLLLLGHSDKSEGSLRG